jgi:hypothetical protein
MYKSGNALSRPVLMGRGLDVYVYPCWWRCSFQAPLGPRALIGPRSRRFSVVIARGKHLFPFRTEPLSPSAPMVLGAHAPGRVGRRRFFLTQHDDGRERPATLHRRRGGSSRAPPSPVAARRGGDGPAHDGTRPRGAARGRIRPAWRSRSGGRPRSGTAGRSSVARGSLRAAR